MKLGTMYAVGVGTGDPELLTLKAHRILSQADVVAFPEKDAGSQQSFAQHIVDGSLRRSDMRGEVMFLHFPMTRDPNVNIPAWQKAAETIVCLLRQGKSVAFATEGDPSVYSTWAYIQEELSEILPELDPVIIPGITSVTAIPSQTKIPLADGQERFCVVPATWGLECLERLVLDFDTIMLIKAGRVIPKLTKQLQAMNMLDCATYVSHATTEQQEVYTNLNDVPNEHRYFSMVQLSVRSRRGVLRGTTQSQPCAVLESRRA
ncbi:putative Cobalamin (vitamin B12) biosynthesis CobI/CbiL, precorrin-2 C20-methyltransferase [Vibrio nigripulchritudo MADA3029]|uniref:precorrin-2 C(20)-methyltransferase n=1 Tax=Vibrio nigripulchritudo TaxID=28173 RepID=UPI0003B1C961|nr:precorrin-2 C(20)-methyltransferase [Vibrio nigripulchritudo]CCN48056.1 putative Cobalamin (vitamin B12) biosynthesis CobI/CbiL, precorrin-2 C20-methyltransferase [Vibrio nigripulchritudo MADA3020]CCN52569.1 putative Cobalamin (vitamin B12) biosynthesis CobI/CbiL, precorrin-2 C20-methyltransferase [Vibrio nigripulchritudo MADA3021]CCN60072.1 putative Cobalamin (vitamin B12) biosynthesis CobI/CbiL, precorrin-2 C20-methyltransferase [Vibrio nigripulchritudo MADA3029]